MPILSVRAAPSHGATPPYPTLPYPTLPLLHAFPSCAVAEDGAGSLSLSLPLPLSLLCPWIPQELGQRTERKGQLVILACVTIACTLYSAIGVMGYMHFTDRVCSNIIETYTGQCTIVRPIRTPCAITTVAL